MAFKKLILFVCIVVFVISSAIFPVSGAEKTGYVAFGDSIAAGFGLSAPSEAYPTILAETLGFKLSNLAQNGQTSEELKARIAGLSKKEKDMVSEAQLITISIGGNDLIGEKNRKVVLSEALLSVLSGDYTMSDEMTEIYQTLKDNLVASVSMLRELNPDAVILLQTLYNPYLGGEYTYLGYNIGDRLDYYVQKINETYEDARQESDQFFIVDVAEQMNGVPEYFYTTFDFHPTAAGHEAIAKILAQAYQEILSNGETQQEETTAAIPDSDTKPAGQPETESVTDIPGSTPANLQGEETSALPVAADVQEQSQNAVVDYAKIVIIIAASLIFSAVLFLFLRGLTRKEKKE